MREGCGKGVGKGVGRVLVCWKGVESVWEVQLQ